MLCAMRDAGMCNGLNIVQSTQPRAPSPASGDQRLVRDGDGIQQRIETDFITAAECANLITSAMAPPSSPSPGTLSSVTTSRACSVKINCRWHKHDCAVRDLMPRLDSSPPGQKPSASPGSLEIRDGADVSGEGMSLLCRVCC